MLKRNLLIPTMMLILLMSIISVQAQSVTRTVPSQVTTEDTIIVTYTFTDSDENPVALIEERVSGGCTPEIVRFGMFNVDTISREFNIPDQETPFNCTFSGDYSYIDEGITFDLVQFGSQSTEIIDKNNLTLFLIIGAVALIGVFLLFGGN